MPASNEAMEAEADSEKKKRWKGATKVIGILLVVALGGLIFLGYVLALLPGSIELPCKPQDYGVDKCPQSHFPYYLWLWPIAFFDFHNGAFQALAGIGSFCFAGVLYFVTRKQAALAQESIDISRQEFLASKRPWIQITDVVPVNGLRWINGDIYITLHVTLKNVGNSPAIYGTMFHQNIELNVKKFPILMEQMKQIEGFIAHANKTIFPGETHVDGATLVIGGAQIEGELERLKTLYDGTPLTWIDITLFVFVVYRATFNDSAYFHTGQVYEFRRRSSEHPPGHPSAFIMFDMKHGQTNIPNHDVQLSLLYPRGEYAD